MAAFMAIITAIPQIFSALKSFIAFIKSMEQKAQDDRANAEAAALKKLGDAQTDQERKDAAGDIARNSF